MNRKAVSLAEGIIVLIILVFLAAVLVPVFLKAKECSHCPNCSRNEKQIGLAFTQYAQDNDMALLSGLTGQGNGWGGQVYPYHKSPGVFRCPEDPTQARGTLAPMSYGYSRNLALRPRVPPISLPNKTVEAFEARRPSPT